MGFCWLYLVVLIFCIAADRSGGHSRESTFENTLQSEDDHLEGVYSPSLRNTSKLEMFFSFFERIPSRFDVYTSSKVLTKLVYPDQTEVEGNVTNITAVNYVNNSTDSEWAFSTLRKYRRRDLRKWRPAPIVENYTDGPGEMGTPFRIGADQCCLMKKKFKENEFNLLASNMISLNRSLADVRHPDCKTKYYPSKLPTTSIVIAFHNEALSTLLRTVWSVINRSPRPLLKEIILVDDASDRDFLGENLENYVESLPIPAMVLRAVNRSGVTGARLLGASHATGQVLAFIDSHCECTEGWFEPLLARIARDRSTVVSPIIDVISDETFEYKTSTDQIWGGFNRKLNFRWYQISTREMARRHQNPVAPIRLPVMAGIFLIDKDFFYEIGSYDDGMQIWGFDNIEISLRIWQCGGSLEMIPCSRVGHVFRKKSPYSFPGGVDKNVLHNAARVAEVWLDEWRDFYYLMAPGARKASGDVSDRIALRERLKCKSFRWYLENIYPETQMPFDYHYFGEIKHAEYRNCLDIIGKSDILQNTYCHGLGANQIFAYTKQHQIMSNEYCLDAANSLGQVNLVRCKGMKGDQEWYYDVDEKWLKHVNSGNCLEYANPHLLKPCKSSYKQKWLMLSPFKWQAN